MKIEKYFQVITHITFKSGTLLTVRFAESNRTIYI